MGCIGSKHAKKNDPKGAAGATGTTTAVNPAPAQQQQQGTTVEGQQQMQTQGTGGQVQGQPENREQLVARMEKGGWKADHTSSDSCDKKTGVQVHDETLHGTRTNKDTHTSEELHASIHREEGNGQQTEVRTQAYSFTQSA
eukprot:TRINITY_DN2752_c0_g1_i1.p1 TRINITY_DN2752_c0_g1~~TRINITY_DN2752_c0_g1_i1.p1  ORF type:complete len:141 (+),score=44.13 TRINITY_DN2752_c0_g1_i1:67-489(+)